MKVIQDLEKVHDREVLLFLNMCKKEDGNFLNLPLKKRKIEDAVRLLCITTALSLRGPFFSCLLYTSFAHWLEENGAEYVFKFYDKKDHPKLSHVFDVAFPHYEESQQAISEMLDFFEKA